MPIHKIIPSVLNKSNDERLVKQNEMTDAQNVTVSTDTDGNAFVLKNVKGTQAVLSNSPGDLIDTTYSVLGSCVDEEDQTIYFIAYDTEGTDHAIFRIDMSASTPKYEEVFASQYLFDSEPEYVDMDVLRADVNQSGTIVPILYFTDGISNPKKLNVNRAMDASDAGGYANAADIKEFLDVAKTKPLVNFSIETSFDEDFDGNFIYGRNLSFAMQWVYKDGERSALSNVSNCMIPQIYLTQEEDGQRKSGANYYSIGIEKGGEEVTEVYVYFRDNETGAMFLADRLSKDTDLKRNGVTIYDESESLYKFYGDQDFEPIPLIEANKLFDNVPLTAKTQCIVDGRLMYGNYKEGRALPTLEAELSVEYSEEYSDNKGEVTVDDLTGGGFELDGDELHAVDLSIVDLPTTVPANTRVDIDISFESQNLGALRSAATFDGVYEFVYSTGTYEVGRNSVAALGFVPDIRLVTSYTAPSAMSNTTFLNNLKSKIDSVTAQVIIKNSGGTSFTSQATRILGSGTSPITVTIEQAVINYSFVATVTPDGVAIVVQHKNSSNVAIRMPDSSLKSGADITYNYSDVANRIWPVVDGGGTAAIRDNGTAYVTTTGNEYKTFKRGANHTFGVILYDEKGRSSFVNELGSTYVQTKGELNDATKHGKASVRISYPQIGGSNQTLPSWVSKYQYVYGGSDIETFKQYSVSGGFANYWSYSDFDSDDTKEDASKNIYVSLKGWSGANSSYCGENGANHVYNPKEGDVLRVIHYDVEDSSGSVLRYYPEKLEFPVVGKKTLRKDVVTNDINATRAEIDFENKRDENKQSRRDKRAQKRKEKGKDGPGLLTRIGRGFDKVGDKFNDFADDRPFIDRLFTNRDEKMEMLLDQEEEALNKIKDTPLSARNPIFPGGGELDADGNYVLGKEPREQAFAKGEFLILKDPGHVGWGRADAVQISFDTTGSIPYPLQTDTDPSDGTEPHWFPILNWARNVVVEVYTPGKAKPRRIYQELSEVFDAPASLPTSGDLISDGNVWMKRVPVKLLEKETVAANRSIDHFFRYWDIDGMSYTQMYLESEEGSHFFASDGSMFGRSHFVNKFAAENNRAHSITYSDKYSSDSPFINLSNFNLSKANFIDLDSSYGTVDRLLSEGNYITCLQSAKASRIPVGEMAISLSQTTDVLTRADNILGKPSMYAGDYGTRGVSQACVKHDGRTYFVDYVARKVLQLAADGLTDISANGMDSYFEENLGDWSKLTTKSRLHVGYDPDYDEVLVFANSDSAESFDGFCVAYNANLKRWTSRYTFEDVNGSGPTLFEKIGDQLVSCKPVAVGIGGASEPTLFHLHTDDAAKTRIYGVVKNSVVEVVSNFNPSMVKVFESVSLEGSSAFDAVITTSDQTSSIASWEERERGYHAMMPRDTSANSTSHKMSIPVAVLSNTTGSSNTIQFASKINRLGLPRGARVYNATKNEFVSSAGGGTGTEVRVSSVRAGLMSLDTFFTTSSVVDAGDKLYLVLDQDENGDAIRDYFCKIKLTNANTSSWELFSVNTHYDRSKLGSETG
jgi:hypothetical protein